MLTVKKHIKNVIKTFFTDDQFWGFWDTRQQNITNRTRNCVTYCRIIVSIP